MNICLNDLAYYFLLLIAGRRYKYLEASCIISHDERTGPGCITDQYIAYQILTRCLSIYSLHGKYSLFIRMLLHFLALYLSDYLFWSFLQSSGKRLYEEQQNGYYWKILQSRWRELRKKFHHASSFKISPGIWDHFEAYSHEPLVS